MNKAIEIFHKQCVKIYIKKSVFLDDVYNIEVEGIKDCIVMDKSKSVIENIMIHMRKNFKFKDIVQKILFTSLTMFVNDIEIDRSQLSVFFKISRDCEILNN